MSAVAVQRAEERSQLDLYERVERPSDAKPPQCERSRRRVTPLCAACRAREARYGFRDEELPEPSRTLCFGCFHLEVVRRQAHADALARARNATQLELPMSEKLREIHLRRRRAQIAARRALGL
jgi:hypothetical protein